VKRQRGQGLVELVLGSLVFVTILLVGIHFGEVMVTSMKVSEAGTAPLWDATAGLHHRILTLDYSPTGDSLNAARNDAAVRYANFDGRSVSIGRPTLTQVLTRGRDLNITECGMGNGAIGTYRGSLNPAHWLIFRDNGNARCNAEAFVQGEGMMRFGAFMEDASSFFQARQKSGAAWAAGGFKVCALNRPRGLNGRCQGQFSMVIDDFGLASGSEGRQCPSIIYGLPCAGGNLPFWTATNLAYIASSAVFNTQSNQYENYMRAMFWGDSPARHSIVPWVPYISTPVSFHMSFTGMDAPVGPFSAFTPWASDPILFSWYWNGSPFLMPFAMPFFAFRDRDNECYLGRKCADLP
jgi:hypothetical protein